MVLEPFGSNVATQSSWLLFHGTGPDI